MGILNSYENRLPNQMTKKNFLHDIQNFCMVEAVLIFSNQSPSP